MESLVKEATQSTPEINFDPEKNLLVIKGESYPENSFKFYGPILEWLKEYLSQVEEEVDVEVMISYLNTSSIKSMMGFFDLLEQNYKAGTEINIDWYYEEENELAYETGLEFEELIEIPFNIVAENEK